jgi:hypothetical protein
MPIPKHESQEEKYGMRSSIIKGKTTKAQINLQYSGTKPRKTTKSVDLKLRRIRYRTRKWESIEAYLDVLGAVLRAIANRDLVGDVDGVGGMSC